MDTRYCGGTLAFFFKPEHKSDDTKKAPTSAEDQMTYRELFHLKFHEGVTTEELRRRYPDKIHKVTEVALLDVPEEILREVVFEEEVLRRLMRLKRRLGRELAG